MNQSNPNNPQSEFFRVSKTGCVSCRLRSWLLPRGADSTCDASAQALLGLHLVCPAPPASTSHRLPGLPYFRDLISKIGPGFSDLTSELPVAFDLIRCPVWELSLLPAPWQPLAHFSGGPKQAHTAFFVGSLFPLRPQKDVDVGWHPRRHTVLFPLGSLPACGVIPPRPCHQPLRQHFR